MMGFVYKVFIGRGSVMLSICVQTRVVGGNYFLSSLSHVIVLGFIPRVDG
jgi:hypothetical protein